MDPCCSTWQPRRHLGGGVSSWRTGVEWTAHTGGGSNLIFSIVLCGPRYHPVKAAPTTTMRHALPWRRQPPIRDEWVLRPGRAAPKRAADWIRVGPAPLHCAAAILQCPAPPRDAPGLQWLAGCWPSHPNLLGAPWRLTIPQPVQPHATRGAAYFGGRLMAKRARRARDPVKALARSTL